MIDGTKQFRGKNSPASPTENPSENSPRPAGDAVNLDRRAWFGALLPAAGDGLVKLLRVSNNLQRDLHETWKTQAGALLEDSSEPGQKTDEAGQP